MKATVFPRISLTASASSDHWPDVDHIGTMSFRVGWEHGNRIIPPGLMDLGVLPAAGDVVRKNMRLALCGQRGCLTPFSKLDAACQAESESGT